MSVSLNPTFLRRYAEAQQRANEAQAAYEAKVAEAHRLFGHLPGAVGEVTRRAYYEGAARAAHAAQFTASNLWAEYNFQSECCLAKAA